MGRPFKMVRAVLWQKTTFLPMAYRIKRIFTLVLIG